MWTCGAGACILNIRSSHRTSHRVLLKSRGVCDLAHQVYTTHISLQQAQVERMLAARQKAAAHEAKLKAGKGKEVRAEAAAEKKAAADKAAAAKYSAELAKAAQVQKSHQKK